jgi:hypothetical protein
VKEISLEALGGHWLMNCKQAVCEMTKSEPEFAKWLEEEYIPIAGGWQY